MAKRLIPKWTKTERCLVHKYIDEAQKDEVFKAVGNWWNSNHELEKEFWGCYCRDYSSDIPGLENTLFYIYRLRNIKNKEAAELKLTNFLNTLGIKRVYEDKREIQSVIKLISD